MIEAVKEQSNYEPIFRAVAQSAGEAAWLRSLRDRAFARFQEVGFPTVAEEDWKYTNVAPIAKGNFEPLVDDLRPPLQSEKEIARYLYDETRQSRLVFIDGIFSSELSNLSALPPDVVALDLLEAIEDPQHGEVVREHLAAHANHNDDGFTALNTAMFRSGAFLRIPRGANIETPIQLLFLFEARLPAITSFPRILIVAEENSAATVIESYAHISNGPGFTNAVTEIVVAPSARLHHYKLQTESREVFHVANTQINMRAKSSFDTTNINFGAKLARHTIGVRMDEEGAECAVDGLYMLDGNQHSDTHSVIDHRQPHCTSRQLYKGILDGQSRAVFNGKVFVRHGAQQTDAQQTNKNLLLSAGARVDTKPQLEIFADDVKCAHGAAVGQLSTDEKFYLESRGINPTLARNMLTYGFAEEVIEKIGLESIKRQLDEMVLNRLDSSLEIR